MSLRFLIHGWWAARRARLLLQGRQAPWPVDVVRVI